MPPVILARPLPASRSRSHQPPSSYPAFPALHPSASTPAFSPPSPSQPTLVHGVGTATAGAGGGLATLRRRLSKSIRDRGRGTEQKENGGLGREEGLPASVSAPPPPPPPPSCVPSSSSKLAPLLHRFPSLRRSSSTHSGSSPSPSPTPTTPSPPLPSAPIPLARGHSPRSSSSAPPSAYHTPPTGPTPSPAGSAVVPLPLSSSPRRSISTPSSVPAPAPVPTPHAPDPQKRAMTVPLLPTSSSARPSRPPAHAKPFHALLELLLTERHYVRDLSILVDVYLPALASVVSPATYSTVARNLPTLRVRHVKFLRKLEQALDWLPGIVAHGVGGGEDERGPGSGGAAYPEVEALERVVAGVARLLVDSEDTWRLYEPYCAHHSQALEALERVAAKMGPAEWRAWERKCAEVGSGGSVGGSRASSPGHDEERERGSGGRPLALADQLVKPVQQICRYPLLLEKLLPLSSPSSSHLLDSPASGSPDSMDGTSDEPGIADAWELMRVVARRVNEARDLRSREVRGERILTRLEPLGGGVRSPPPLPHIPAELWTNPVLFGKAGQASSSSSGGVGTGWEALGTPVLVGGLDVLVVPSSSALQWPIPTPTTATSPGPSPHGSMSPGTPMGPSPSSASSSGGSSLVNGGQPQPQPQPALKVRYLGALLYPGHLLLVKPRKQAVYEPRHCLDLRDCVLVDTPSSGGEDSDAPFPNGFCLAVGDDARFFFGAACAQERAVWVPALAHVLAQLGQEGGSGAGGDDEDHTDMTSITTATPTLTTTPTSLTALTALQAVLRRPSPSHRQASDRLLADVFSEPCVTARAGCTLFADPSLPPTTTSVSTAGSFSRMMRRSESSPAPTPAASEQRDTTSGLSGSPAAPTAAAATMAKRKRLSVRSLNSLPISFSADDSVLTSVPESVGERDEETGGTGRPANRRRRTYSQTMQSVRDAFSPSAALAAKRPASVQNLLNLNRAAMALSSASNGDGERENGSVSNHPTARPTPSKSAFSFMSVSFSRPSSLTRSSSSRLRTHSAPDTASLSPGSSVRTKARPPPVDTSVGMRNANGSTPKGSNSGPGSPLEFHATGRYTESVLAAAAAGANNAGPRSPVVSAEGYSQEGGAGGDEVDEEDETSPCLSEESSTLHAVHIRTPSDDVSSFSSSATSTTVADLSSGRGMMDFRRLMPEDVRKLNLSSTTMTPQSMRGAKKASTGFLGRLNPFTPVV